MQREEFQDLGEFFIWVEDLNQVLVINAANSIGYFSPYWMNILQEHVWFPFKTSSGKLFNILA